MVSQGALAQTVQADETATGSDPSETGSGPSQTRLDASLEVSGGYADNIFATRNREVDDFLFTIEPRARLTLGGDGTYLVLRGQGEIGRYADYDSEDYDDWLVGANSRLAVSSDVSVVAGGEWRWDHENRSSPDAVSGLEPTEYERGYGFAGLLLSPGPVNLRAAVTATRYDFADVATTGGTINNDDRDRTLWDLGLRAGYEVDPGLELFVQGSYDSRDYDDAFDDFGYMRESDGYSLVAGFRHRFSNRLTGEIFAGYLNQDYDDPRLSDVETVDFGAVVDWTGPAGLSASLRVDRSVEETTLPGASAYVLTGGTLSVRMAPHPRVLAGFSIRGSHYDYRGFPRSEFITGAGLWGRYWLNRHLYLGADYSLAQRTSNSAGYDFDENRFFIQLGAQLQPRYRGEAAPLAFGGAAPGGFYAAVLLGHGTLVTGVDGPRGPGSNTADFGEDGLSYGGAIGYGFVSGPVYVGVELEAMADGPDWLHESDRLFSVEKKNSFGAAVRLGHVTPWGDLLYGRIGVSTTEFGTYYFHAGNLSDENDRRLGLAYGLGVEAGVGRRGFVRAEYVLTSYRDYDVPTGGGNFDNFSSSENQFRLGAGIRFGAAAAEEDTASPVDFSGPYIGLLLGHGALATGNIGVRTGGRMVDIARSSQGPLLGAVAGYGTLLGAFYAGAEAEANISNIDWNIERDPSGRIYSAEHEYSFGINGRLGVRLKDSALLFGRVGVVRTRFDIHYATTGTSVRSQDTETGLVVGGGLELGLGSDVRVRIEYSRTTYGQYDVEYGLNSEGFDHAESVVGLGVLLRL
jgi:hypothetical protein